MKFTTILSSAAMLGSFAALGAASPAPMLKLPRQNNATGNGANSGSPSQPSPEDIQNAVNNWMANTGKVSNFLNIAEGISGENYHNQAQIAQADEKDELNHKAVLDQAFGYQSGVQTANDSLVTNGHFQAVINALAVMVQGGPSVATDNVNIINLNRCKNVLPSIDAYFAAAGTSQTSVRPKVCGADAVNAAEEANDGAVTGNASGGNSNASSNASSTASTDNTDSSSQGNSDNNDNVNDASKTKKHDGKKHHFF